MSKLWDRLSKRSALLAGLAAGLAAAFLLLLVAGKKTALVILAALGIAAVALTAGSVHHDWFSMRVADTRPCSVGQRDVTPPSLVGYRAGSEWTVALADIPQGAWDAALAEPQSGFQDVTVCGVLRVESQDNALTNEGAADVFATYFAASARTAGNTWYVLLTSATPIASSTLANITEISGGGYARRPITWDFTTSRHAKTGNVIFTATSAWPSAATYMGLTNAGAGTSGTLFNYVTLAVTRQPQANGDTITVSWDGNL